MGGLRSYLSEGAILVVGPGTSAHYRRILSAPHTRNPYLPQAIKTTRIQEVTDHVVITDGSDNLGLYAVDNLHAAGMLMGYLPDTRLTYVTDIWAPGFQLRQPLTDKLSPTQATLVKTVRKFALQPERFYRRARCCRELFGLVRAVREISGNPRLVFLWTGEPSLQGSNAATAGKRDRLQ